MDKKIEPNVKTIENAALDDVRAGDYLIRTRTKKYGDADITEIREGTARHRNDAGIWCTEGGMWLAFGEGKGITLTIRRHVRELPTTPGTVIVANDGCEAIRAEIFGHVWHVSEAVLGGDGHWHGVWRGESGQGAIGAVIPEAVISNTWKVKGE